MRWNVTGFVDLPKVEVDTRIVYEVIVIYKVIVLLFPDQYRLYLLFQNTDFDFSDVISSV
jgi:hypothetical protein